MDTIVYELFGTSTDPMDLAVRFLIVILLMDGIFGIVGVLFKPLLEKR